MVSFLKKLAKFQHAVIFISIIFCVLIAYIIGVPILQLVELKTLDLRFRSRGTIQPGSEIVLAVIDDKSIAREGRWPWPRIKIAHLVDRLSASGARVIAFDIGFVEPDNKHVVETIEEISRGIQDLKIVNRDLNQYIENIKIRSNNDKQLADSIKTSRAKVVLGYFFQTDQKKAELVNREEIQMHQENIDKSKYPLERYSSNKAYDVHITEAVFPRSNIKIISDASEYAGYFNIYTSKEDGVVRRTPGVLKFNDTMYAPLSIMAISAYLETDLILNIVEDYGVHDIQVGDIEIPTDELGRILINYRGKEKLFKHISATDILNDQIPGSEFKGKIVMVGVTALAVYDLRVTPFGSIFPGLEVHANITDSILRNDFLYRPEWAGLIDFLAIILAGLFLGILLPRVSVVPGLLISLSLFFGYIFFCQYLFSTLGLVINMVYPLTAILLVYLSITAYRYFVETKQRRFIKDAFSTYLAPSVVKQLTESPELLKLGGEEREITAFFSDVQGFTSISEALHPNELVELLNEFLTEMTDIILKHEGTVDKFEGDAIIAFFGAPNFLENHSERTCMACIQMQKRLSKLRKNWRGENRPELKMRIGLCTGPAVVGNMGSKNRMDYTMMGDTVNIAARLEGINKIYGIYTLVSETTRHAAGNTFMFREIDSVSVVGRTEPVIIFELIGLMEEVNPSIQNLIDNYSRGLEKYRARKWDNAINFFSSLLEEHPDDNPSKTMLARCREYKIDPPDSSWDGTYDIKTK